MAKGLFTQGMCVLLREPITVDKLQEQLKSFNLVGRQESLEDDEAPETLVFEFDKETNGHLLVTPSTGCWPDDMGDPDLAIQQARKLVADPDVVIVLGHWRDETTQAALPIYEEAGLPLIPFSTQDMSHSPGVYNLAPSEDEMLAAAQAWSEKESTPDMLWLGDSEDVIASAGQLATLRNSMSSTFVGGPVWGMNQFYALTGGMAENAYFVTGAAEPHDASGEYWTDERIKEFTVGFEQGSLGASPGLFSISAYEATWLAIKQALATYGILIDGTPVDTWKFDERGRHVDAPIYLYVWRDGQRELVEQLR